MDNVTKPKSHKLSLRGNFLPYWEFLKLKPGLAL